MTIMAASRTKTLCFTGHQIGLLIVLAILASPASGKISDAAENFEAKGSEGPQDAGKASESWADWAYGKLQKGLGWPHENTGMAAKNVQDKAFHAKDKTTNKAGDAKQQIKSTAGEAQETLHSRADDAYAGTKKTSKRAGDAADKAYDEAKQKASEAYESAKESMSTGAKRAYEAAKEKVSQATGDLGAAMTPDEL
ncbi:late embryogenesis abundant protein Dc3-like [Phalaenopsis equestris]|uniref:late embryogenesis abundant protein Dc3-like n=1 Tax=Phalaenopsis equestris TaxID=78828 RepID=UPI0009E52BFC|nr:late embryogenesis abundant protein Dc3-like [Phalaenopsis equestris]